MKGKLSSTQLTGIDSSAFVVLLVDDEPHLLHGLSRALRRQPYQIYTARCAEEAMELLKAHRIDLVISDENMPGISGTEFLSWVANKLPEVRRIVLSGQPSVPSMLRALNECRVYRYFTKPCDIVELAFAIRQGLEEKSNRLASALEDD